MKATRKLLAGVIATTIFAGTMAPVANAEISASAGVANIYLWRGLDLSMGQGTPAVFGDITLSAGGFYGSVWSSSGDATAGTEYDFGVGYGGEVGAFSYDIGVWNYMYPTAGNDPVAGTVYSEDSFGDLSELVVSLGVGPLSVTLYENIAWEGGDETYRYVTLGFEQGPFGLLIGNSMGDASAEYTHVDLSYAYNENLSFTFSQVIDDDDGAVDDDLNFVVSYSIPLK